MKFMHRFNIKKKLIVIILGISTATIVLALAINLISDINNYKTDLKTNAQINARLIGEYCVAPLIFGYSAEVDQVLTKLNSIPYVLNAFVFDSKGNVFGSFHRSQEVLISPPDIPKNLTTRFVDDYLVVIQPINFENEFYGTVYLRVSTQSIETKVLNDILAMVILVLGSIIVSYLLAVYFQKIISRPISNLAEVTSMIAQKNDYSIRVNPVGNDEITDLYKRFNYMFEVIQAEQDERNRAMEEVETLNRELEQKVAERTSELEKAKIVAESASKAKSEFLANTGHELRTPLNIINGNNQLLKMKIDQPNLRKMIINIENSVNQLTSMVNNILSFSETEKGLVELQVIDFKLADLFQYLKLHYEKAAEKKGLILKFSNDDNIPEILKGDSKQLLKALILLVDNAVKFTETGSISVTAKLLLKKNDTNRIGFSVEDTGIGIQPDKLENLFSSFAQIDGSSTRKYGGIGLGLNLSNRIVTLLGGEISIESEPGKGSTFYFELDFIKSNKKFLEKAELNFDEDELCGISGSDDLKTISNSNDGKTEHPQEKSALSKKELSAKLNELKKLLEDYNAEAGNKFKEVGELKGFESEMKELEKNISEYDFEGAALVLDKIKL